jgi:hypothetical protein
MSSTVGRPGERHIGDDPEIQGCFLRRWSVHSGQGKEDLLLPVFNV